MNEKYLISIIMPIYNAEKYLPNAINSVINQTIGFENLELILVDDKSTDNSKIIIEEYASKYKNIKPIYANENSGSPGAGRNKGLNIATSNYIMFIDSDDEYKENACEILYKTITENNCDLVKFKYETIDSLTNNSLNKNNSTNIICLDSQDAIYDIGAMVWDKIFKKTIIDKNNIKFVTDRIGEDILFSLEYCIHSKTIIYLNEYYGYNYFIREDSFSTVDITWNLNFIDNYFDRLNLLKKFNVNVELNKFFDRHIDGIIINTIKMIENDWDSISKVLNKLYLFEKEINFNNNYKTKSYFKLINFFILKRYINIATFIILIANHIYKSKFIVKMYRKIYKRFNKIN